MAEMISVREAAVRWNITERRVATLCKNGNIKADDFEALKNFAVENGVDMVVVGPEDPLVKGVYDD